MRSSSCSLHPKRRSRPRSNIQRALTAHPWPGGVALRVRIGLHTGSPVPSGEGYVGIDLHRGARICAAGHGGQVVLSKATRDAVGEAIAPGIVLRALGAHRLKDLEDPLTLFDVAIDGLDDRFPPLRAIGSRPTNLAGEPMELIGRDAELSGLAALLEQVRLVTLVGPGGTGKTSLAMRVAAELLPRFPDGAFAVSLAPVSGADLVASAAASALGLREQPGRSFAETLGDYLADREMLLVMDNFEHVLDAAPLVEDLLARAPGLRILVTSRVALRLRDERAFPVPPLSLAPDADGVEAAPAVVLFAERAVSAKPGFALDDASGPAVEEICARLDGLPLAIELAAARVRLMSPTAMLARLEHPLELAAGGPRHAPTRQQALRATIEWSHQLLSDRQRRLFARLGVFAAPFSIEAAEDVCEAGLDELAGLLDQSLLRAHEEGPGAERLEMLATIRAFAAERLEASGEQAAMRDRHASWCIDFARAASPQLLSGAHEALLPRFDAEQDDLRAALDWLLASGQAHAALRLAGHLAVFWDTRGLLGEGRARLEQTLAAAAGADDVNRARALFSLGRMATAQGDWARASATLSEALDLHRSFDDTHAIMLDISHLGAVTASQPGGRADGQRLGEEALAIARSSGDPWTIAVALNNLAVLISADDTERARQLLDESVNLRRGLGERRLLAISLGNAGEVAIAEGRIAQAEAMLDEALAIAISLDFEPMKVWTRQSIARISLGRGEIEHAESLLLDALERAERVGEPDAQAICLFGLAKVAAVRGDDARAGERRRRAERVVAETGVVLSAFDRWEA